MKADKVKFKKSTPCFFTQALLYFQIVTNYEKFIHAAGGLYTNDVCYTDTDSLYIGNKHWEKLDKAGLVGKNGLQGKKKDFENGGIWYALFLAPKKYCLTTNNFGDIDEHKTSKGITNLSENLDRKEYYYMADGGISKAKVLLSWKKNFSQELYFRIN